jgi:hypothetical protein
MHRSRGRIGGWVRLVIILKLSASSVDPKSRERIHLIPVKTSFDVFPSNASLRTIGYFPGLSISIDPAAMVAITRGFRLRECLELVICSL